MWFQGNPSILPTIQPKQNMFVIRKNIFCFQCLSYDALYKKHFLFPCDLYHKMHLYRVKTFCKKMFFASVTLRENIFGKMFFGLSNLVNFRKNLKRDKIVIFHAFWKYFNDFCVICTS